MLKFIKKIIRSIFKVKEGCDIKEIKEIGGCDIKEIKETCDIKEIRA